MTKNSKLVNISSETTYTYYTKDTMQTQAIMEESTSWSITSIGKVVLRWYFLTWLSVVNSALGIIVANIFRFLFNLWNFVGSIVLMIFFRDTEEKATLPPIGNRKLLRLSVTDIADQIRRREITSEEVVRTFINRIGEVNHHVTALVDARFDLAIEEARKVDKLIQSGEYDEMELEEKFPLLGVPFTIKDSFCVAGLKHTAGLYHRSEIIAPQDADVVKALKQGGAIPLGVTNVSELCMWWESVNTVYGRSKNPYDTRFITGGSSGGEGALQGCAGSGFGVGSDIAGSIRMPSFFCGIFGHKPTTGLISNFGQVPETFGRLAELLTTGPMARHARDLRLIINVMLGDNIKKVNPVPDMKQIRVLYMVHDGGSPLAKRVDNEMQQCVRKSVQHLERKFGIKPQMVDITKFYHSLEIWAQTMCGAGAVPFCEELALKQGKVNPFWELLKFPFNASTHTFPALVLGIVEKVAYIGTKIPRHQTMIDMGYSFAKEFQELMKDDAILIYPSHPTAAPKHHAPWLAPADFSYCGIFNVLGVPVTQVPLGLGSKGLPVGVQVVGGMYSDHLTMKVAEELEAAFGGWVPPS